MTRLATLVRVAELQEAAARGQAARALAATAAARQVHADRLEVLTSGAVAGGSRDALTSSAQLQLTRAQAVADADVDVQAALHGQDQAVAGWTEAQRRHKLFTELLERHREARRVAQEKADQQLADELVASRRREEHRR